jgi:hypothetical protein
VSRLGASAAIGWLVGAIFSGGRGGAMALAQVSAGGISHSPGQASEGSG